MRGELTDIIIDGFWDLCSSFTNGMGMKRLVSVFEILHFAPMPSALTMIAKVVLRGEEVVTGSTLENGILTPDLPLM